MKKYVKFVAIFCIVTLILLLIVYFRNYYFLYVYDPGINQILQSGAQLTDYDSMAKRSVGELKRNKYVILSREGQIKLPSVASSPLIESTLIRRVVKTDKKSLFNAIVQNEIGYEYELEDRITDNLAIFKSNNASVVLGFFTKDDFAYVVKVTCDNNLFPLVKDNIINDVKRIIYGGSK